MASLEDSYDSHNIHYSERRNFVNGMALSARAKHSLHCILLLLFIITFEVFSGALQLWPHSIAEPLEGSPMERYGIIGTVLLYALRVASLLVLPQCLFNCAGLLYYNGFTDRVQLACAPMMAPFICFRVVTRGDYPNLVKSNVERNIGVVNEVGLLNYIFEVVTDKRIDLPETQLQREVVVPASYKPKSGAMYKARALQYCLEADVTLLPDDSWIVHLDEETLLTANSVRGIVNFCYSGTHQFGQGLITYASGEIVNWLTTFCDTFRVADDLGKLRLQLNYFHKPLFAWKGSYVVTRLGAEKKVSFDNGPDGSIAEDCYFAMIAYRDGYSFDFIDGEMNEKSPFTLWDFLQQRKRWIQGIYLTVHSSEIPWRIKIFLACSFYAWATLPFTVMNVFLANLCPLPRMMLFDMAVSFVGAMSLYMYVYGALKSFAHRYRQKSWHAILYTIGAVLAIPCNVCIEITAVLWGLIGNKHRFYVVDKDYTKQEHGSLLTVPLPVDTV